MPNVTIPSPNTPLVDENQVLDADWYLFFYTLFQYSRCNYDLRLGGILDNSSEAVSSSGASATDLIDYVFEKKQLINDNDCLLFSFKGIYATNANNKKIILTFGSQTIFDTTALAVNGGAWIFEVEVIRTSITSQDIFVKAFYNNLTKTAYISGTQDLSDNIAIKLTATGISSGDIQSKCFCFTLNPVD